MGVELGLQPGPQVRPEQQAQRAGQVALAPLQQPLARLAPWAPQQLASGWRTRRPAARCWQEAGVSYPITPDCLLWDRYLPLQQPCCPERAQAGDEVVAAQFAVTAVSSHWLEWLARTATATGSSALTMWASKVREAVDAKTSSNGVFGSSSMNTSICRPRMAPPRSPAKR